jgi:putative endonuclease
MNKNPFVYILVSARNGTVYAGVTSDLLKRIWEHKNNIFEGFTKRYAVHKLVWFEKYETMENAIVREKPSKNGRENGSLN